MLFYLKLCFDTIDHTLLMIKLKKIYTTISLKIGLLRRLRQINPAACLPKYYMATTQSVKNDGNISLFNNLTVVEPQCSVLDPLLFLIFIDDFPTCLTQTSINIYADDSVNNAADIYISMAKQCRKLAP